MIADIEVENHGTIFLLRPLTTAGQEWLNEHIPEDAQTMGNAVACEPRYAIDIVVGMQRDGLFVV